MTNFFELCEISETKSRFRLHDGARQPQGFAVLSWDGERLHIDVENKNQQPVAKLEQAIDFEGK